MDQRIDAAHEMR